MQFVQNDLRLQITSVAIFQLVFRSHVSYIIEVKVLVHLKWSPNYIEYCA